MMNSGRKKMMTAAAVCRLSAQRITQRLGRPHRARFVRFGMCTFSTFLLYVWPGVCGCVCLCVGDTD